MQPVQQLPSPALHSWLQQRVKQGGFRPGDVHPIGSADGQFGLHVNSHFIRGIKNSVWGAMGVKAQIVDAIFFVNLQDLDPVLAAV